MKEKIEGSGRARGNDGRRERRREMRLETTNWRAEMADAVRRQCWQIAPSTARSTMSLSDYISIFDTRSIAQSHLSEAATATRSVVYIRRYVQYV